MKKLVFISTLLALTGTGCNAQEAQLTEQLIPVVVNYLCDLASDQGSAEPGFETDICTFIDPVSGQPVATKTFTMQVKKGLRPKMKVVKP